MKNIFVISIVSTVLLGGLLLYKGEEIISTFLMASLVERTDVSQEDVFKSNTRHESVNILEIKEDDYVLGSLEADNKVVIFSSPTEISLRRVFLENIIDDAESKKIYVIWRHLVLSEQDKHFALAMECAGEQGAFWNYLIAIYEEMIKDSEEIVKFIDIDYNQYQKCIRGERYLPKIEEESSLARKEGIYKAPEIFINDKRVPMETIRNILNP